MPRRERTENGRAFYPAAFFGAFFTGLAITSALNASFDLGLSGFIGKLLDFYEIARGYFSTYVLKPVANVLSELLPFEIDLRDPWGDVAVVTMSYAIIQAKDSLQGAYHRGVASMLRVFLGIVSIFFAYVFVHLFDSWLDKNATESVLFCTTVSTIIFRFFLSFQIAGDRVYGHWNGSEPAYSVFAQIFSKKIRTCLVPLYCFLGSLLFNVLAIFGINNPDLIDLLSFLSFFPLMGYAHIQMNGGFKARKNTGNFEIAVMLVMGFAISLAALLAGSNYFSG